MLIAQMNPDPIPGHTVDPDRSSPEACRKIHSQPVLHQGSLPDERMAFLDPGSQ